MIKVRNFLNLSDCLSFSNVRLHTLSRSQPFTSTSLMIMNEKSHHLNIFLKAMSVYPYNAGTTSIEVFGQKYCDVLFCQ